MRSTCLQGAPGSGKTRMACLTAINKPIYAIDLDRKILGTKILEDAVEKGELIVEEFSETISEGSLEDRISRLAKDQKPAKEPQGWKKIAAMIEGLPKNERAKSAGTILIDSWSAAVDHIVQSILYNASADRANAVMNQRQWGQLIQMNREAITVAIDVCKYMNKDLIVTVHERVSEIPGASTKIIKAVGGAREFVGQMDVKIAASIPGQFGIEMARYFNEFYGLEVKIVNGEPKWICRVKPDGKRDLRTSFNVGDKTEFPCDFREIWK